MPRAKWSQEQIIGILKQVGAGRSMSEVCRENGMGESTFYKCKRKFIGQGVKQIAALREENRLCGRILNAYPG